MAKKPAKLPEVDLDVIDVRHVAITTNVEGETLISLEIVGGQAMNLVFSPETLAKLEALLAKANAQHAKRAPIQ
ncbi:hypothetical protein [Bosea sp. NBC_00550]|uniref:hypothetical protein n=1 Tax=Bosea sp. NBC_00550 TaxID=2969621 RepID=UPI00222F8274|nr:hypothetical protein [Bosea sp. NBC_00550]UZF95648.1 hypothetical protein NWE53_29795 [Bosea sp. NBC_00550]